MFLPTFILHVPLSCAEFKTLTSEKVREKTWDIIFFFLSRTRETKHLWTDADRSIDSQKNTIIFAWQFYNIYEQKFSNLRPPLFIPFPREFRKCKKLGHWTSGSGVKKTLKRSKQMKNSIIFCCCRGDFTPFGR